MPTSNALARLVVPVLLLISFAPASVVAQGDALTNVRPKLDSLSQPRHAAFVAAANEARLAAGLSPQEPHPDLAAAAQLHAEEMAALGYFSHTSPTPGRATALDRIALVGGSLISIAENLASVGGSDVVARTIDGWLASPGHRSNLLRADHDRVGFGFAQDARGDTYVVQLSAFEPRSLLATDAVTSERRFYRITVDLRTERAVDALVALGAQPPVEVRVPAGGYSWSIDVEDDRAQQLRVGVALPDDVGYVVDAAGWIEPGSGAFTPEAEAPREVLRVAGVHSETVVQRVTRVTLRYAPGASELALFVDGAYRAGAEQGPGVLAVDIAAHEVPTSLAVGVAEGQRVVLFHRFTLVPAPDGRPVLVPGDSQREGG